MHDCKNTLILQADKEVFPEIFAILYLAGNDQRKRFAPFGGLESEKFLIPKNAPHPALLSPHPR